MKKKGNYFKWALITFGVLSLDFLVYFLDYTLYGEAAINGDTNYKWYMNFTHLIIVIILWSLFILFILKKSPFSNNYFDFHKPRIKSFIVAISLSIICTLVEYIVEPSILPQFLHEYINFQNKFGSYGLMVSLAQNIYYFLEGFLVVFLLSFMQSAGENKFNKILPYGSVGLVFTWGITHVMHGVLAGVFISFLALIFGILYLKAKKNFWTAYLFIILIFII
ncbi:MAG: hypothetical protein PUE01_10510 [Clostridiaceae bacterium]|nr:hypothetical protein [Clostridiaceae bacterium]